ncbi:two-component response regulator ORR26 [Sesamum indicum]|uniref:Two-component response regulator n=1 Tax=Sesamum indicum TaxID=4182 RepID=A0A6I9TMI4_SESIN|nr:two-component response regulator ORR26 [Sesamum indicum]
MDSSGFSSPRSGSFPAGLRVLVVEDDPTCLKIVEKMLKKCNYDVTTCKLTQEALDLLQARKDGFDIVISDVNMPDMDGFKLLEHVGGKMDLPVIMMSVDGTTSRVMKGIQDGACDYLLKPLRIKELQNIWQHVIRKRMHGARDTEGQESLDVTQMTRNGKQPSNDHCSFSRCIVSGKKRKGVENKCHDGEYGDPSSKKKPRLFWDMDLHQKFEKAVHQIGLNKVGPKKILELMGVPSLTRENVASHLQKYRLYLSRMQEENKLKAVSGGLKFSDIYSKEPAGNVCLQSSISRNSLTVPQNVVYVHEKEIMIHNHDAKICNANVKGVLSVATEPKTALSADMTDTPLSSNLRMSSNHSFGPLPSEVRPESKIDAQYSWSGGVPSFQFKQETRPHFQSEQLFDHLPLPMPQLQADSVSHNSTSSSRETDKPIEPNINLYYAQNRSHVKVENSAALFSVQPEPFPCSVWGTTNYSLEQNLYDNMESSQKNLIAGIGSALRLSDEEFISYQNDFSPPDPGLVNTESVDFSNQGLIVDAPYFHNSVNF